MKKMVRYLGMTAGSAVGWAIGQPVSIFTAFVVSMVGLGVGLYSANRIIARYM